MGFPQGLSASAGGSGGQGWTRQPVLPEIPTEVLWFILHLKGGKNEKAHGCRIFGTKGWT